MEASPQSLSHLLCSATLSQHQERCSWKTVAVGTLRISTSGISMCLHMSVYSAANSLSCLGLSCSSLIVLTWYHHGIIMAYWKTYSVAASVHVFIHKCAQVRVRFKICLNDPRLPHTHLQLDYFISPFLGEKRLALWWLKWITVYYEFFFTEGCYFFFSLNYKLMRFINMKFIKC